MKQDLFDFGGDDDAPASKPAPAPAPGPKTYAWQWHDPWPAGLTKRQEYVMQIARDMRALEEETEESEKEFYRGRIAAFRADVVKMDGDEPRTQSSR